ncbi:E2F-associated phosphoprotein, putative [Plasmodium malariae]|uniref:E2F-associated phosphoprotein, putative n=2 Tax=Plasmodium malariae TaxID=5858 RepID=A0A1D3JJ76_PLAMA|nr:E2F-associated phosphoprotein, putative [Plasmodium malariae]SBT86452.1 E2F-associated phosphoprotein, putative [Plasmodium malariae]
MNAKKVNNVINLLINEIKLNEQSEITQDLSKEKGINVAKSFLNINCSGKEKVYNPTKREQKGDQQNVGNEENVENEENVGNEENVENAPNNDRQNIPDEQKELSDYNTDDDVIGDMEKAGLEFYDDKIDDYDEEYVNKKYRFCTKSCDSSLCCCGCFIPVCYQSQRHEYYVNQYRSLYAVNIKIDEETTLNEHDVNLKKNAKGYSAGLKEEMKDKEDEVINNSIMQNTGCVKIPGNQKLQKYHAVFCINCNNHIAYFEIKKKIFHFFDVLPD